MRRKITIREPFKLPGRKNYYIEVNRKRISLKTSNEKEARRLYKDICREYERGTQAKYLADSCTVSDFADRFLSWAIHVKPMATYNNNEQALKKLIDVAGFVLLSELTPEHTDKVIEACKKRRLKNTSINTFIRHIKSIFKKAVEWKLLDNNPFTDVKQLPRETDVVPRYASIKEIKVFIEGIVDQDVKDIVAMYFYTGRRRKELMALTWDNVDMKKRSYRIIKSKAHIIYEYPMHDEVFKILKRRKRTATNERVFGRWDNGRTVTRYVKKELCKAGLGHLHLHSLRHSFAMAYLEKGGEIKALRDLMGHEQLSTTEIYTRALSMKRLKNEIRRL